jgi:H+/Cl- antiporter ClcA
MRKAMARPRNVTHNVLIAIAIIFAILAGISTIAWLLPSLFDTLGNVLIRFTGNSDIRLNVARIRSDPIPYAIIFAIIAVGVRWLAKKF